MFTIYSELNGENVTFPSFLESALHVCEVSRSHPDYISAHFHEKVGTDQFKQLDNPGVCLGLVHHLVDK